MKSSKIRQTFIDFFKSKNHIFIPASPVGANNDPTLLFINAGMNQFKPYFLGKQKAPNQRVVNSQPCIRVSGKHNDLEEVGIDTYHHTCFEMLGNWSFGDYYKKDAIIWGWELLTEHYNLPKEHLIATIYEEDEEAYQIWHDDTDINKSNIIKCGKKDNFWEMGATGPCGPCSEIHIDCQPEIGGPPIKDSQTNGLIERYMELWNLVFIQYNRENDGVLKNLPETHIDTGAGLERLAAQLQQVKSNYDTDCFTKLIQSIEKTLGIDYTQGKNGIPHRVISDHIQTVSFAISDNIRPSNDGQGYVLRRLIRRALRFASQSGKNEPFLYQLVPVVNESLNGYYENIIKQEATIKDIIKAEETQFLRTVQSGLKLFHQVIIDLNKQNNTTIDGKTAFKLYDTHGFPIDLTEVMAKEHNMTVDIEQYDKCLQKQQEKSRAARDETTKTNKDDSIISNSNICHPIHNSIYHEHAGGGEARLPANDHQQFGIAQNHTATHLLNASLRKILGDHISQAGSLVDINRLRFDFTHNKPIDNKQIKQINDLVNTWINDTHRIIITEENIEDAKKRGAIAMFGEKYEQHVRVVDIPNVSIELCGGNHVTQTDHIEAFQIISETTIAAGIRRIEAIVGHQRIHDWQEAKKQDAVLKYQQKLNAVYQLMETCTQTNIQLNTIDTKTTSCDVIIKETNKLTTVIKQLEKQLNKDQQNTANDMVTELESKQFNLKKDHGIAIFSTVNNQSIPVLKKIADDITNKHQNAIICIGSIVNDKGHIIVKIGKQLLEHYNANDIIKHITTITGGGGGGREQMAQAGGCDPEKLNNAINTLKETYKK